MPVSGWSARLGFPECRQRPERTAVPAVAGARVLALSGRRGPGGAYGGYGAVRRPGLGTGHQAHVGPGSFRVPCDRPRETGVWCPGPCLSHGRAAPAGPPAPGGRSPYSATPAPRPPRPRCRSSSRLAPHPWASVSALLPQLKARLVSMASEHGLSIVAVDPAYTSMWGDQHWKKPLTSKKRKMSRHDAAGIAIGRRALGHLIRRRTAPPPQHQSDAAGHRTAQAGPGTRGREGTRPPVTERAHDARSRTGTQRTRETSASNTVRDARSSGSWQQMSLLDTV